jgi:hypothetical protein
VLVLVVVRGGRVLQVPVWAWSQGPGLDIFVRKSRPAGTNRQQISVAIARGHKPKLEGRKDAVSLCTGNINVPYVFGYSKA